MGWFGVLAFHPSPVSLCGVHRTTEHPNANHVLQHHAVQLWGNPQPPPGPPRHPSPSLHCFGRRAAEHSGPFAVPQGKRRGADIPQHSLPGRCGAARAGLISLITSRKAPRPPLPSDLPALIGFQQQLGAAPRAPQCWGGS